MSIAVIKVRREPHYRRAALESGLKRLGYTISDARARCLFGGPDDLLVLWNKKAGAEEQEADAWEKAGGTVIVMENGYLQKTDKTTYAISTHGHNGSGWFPVGDEDRFTPLGFEIKPWVHNPDGPWLICGQRGIGSKLMASPPQWAEKLAKSLAIRSVRTKLRQHPGNFAPKVSLIDDLRGAAGCLVWSSGAGVRALVEGYQVAHWAPHWICVNAAAYGPHCDLNRWSTTKCGDQELRPLMLNHMAHGQWHHEEIATGEPFARMRDAGWGPRTWR
jgi:hypothetical protein